MVTYLFFHIFLTYRSSSFCSKSSKKKHMFEKKVITRNALLMEMKSRPREHARKEGFKSISSDASSICHKTSSKLFLVIDSLHLVHCFKICFKYVLLVKISILTVVSQVPEKSCCFTRNTYSYFN